jgi:hypothetical protein
VVAWVLVAIIALCGLDALGSRLGGAPELPVIRTGIRELADAVRATRTRLGEACRVRRTESLTMSERRAPTCSAVDAR